MKYFLRTILVGILISPFVLLMLPKEEAHSWGFYGHRRINRMAVFTLPPEMLGFYKKHIEYITEHAVDPDKRRNAIAEEAPRHYIDIDHYGPTAFDSMPRFWKMAVAKYSEDTLNAYGIVPWWIDVMVYRLTEAFREGNVDKILKYSADLGHYVGDAHVPLHTTENYNGQLTNQHGIHGFWESRIPELYGEQYDYFVGRAFYVESVINTSWEVVRASHLQVDSVLKLEAALNATTPPDRKYGFEQRGNATVKTYSEEYTRAYSTALNGMVERRMRASILMVGSLWYTAWVNAGQPDLAKLETKEVSDSAKAAQEQEEYLWKNGKVKDAKGHDD
ncbi:MAG TPA: zinc dependent phospholipase C family protein [Bacteroidia bacterium]|nr:zinc dependent phospholipase C family protein [Bacteroidia bacterium]